MQYIITEQHLFQEHNVDFFLYNVDLILENHCTLCFE